GARLVGVGVRPAHLRAAVEAWPARGVCAGLTHGGQGGALPRADGRAGHLRLLAVGPGDAFFGGDAVGAGGASGRERDRAATEDLERGWQRDERAEVARVALQARLTFRRLRGIECDGAAGHRRLEIADAQASDLRHAMREVTILPADALKSVDADVGLHRVAKLGQRQWSVGARPPAR